MIIDTGKAGPEEVEVGVSRKEPEGQCGGSCSKSSNESVSSVKGRV